VDTEGIGDDKGAMTCLISKETSGGGDDGDGVVVVGVVGDRESYMSLAKWCVGTTGRDFAPSLLVTLELVLATGRRDNRVFMYRED
jgi:hypothetical protein